MKLYAMANHLSREIFALTNRYFRTYKAGVRLLSTTEAAKRLGVTVARVQALIWKGRLPAQKVGRDYVIQEEDLKLVENRKPGRPPKPKAAEQGSKSKKG